MALILCVKIKGIDMKTKQEIVLDWLPRYTGMPLEKFGEYIILVNFSKYVDKFSKRYNAQVYGRKNAMRAVTAGNITLINFGMGSANAATIMDLLTAIKPKACLFLGKCRLLSMLFCLLFRSVIYPSVFEFF